MPGARAEFGGVYQEELALGAALVLYSKACQWPVWLWCEPRFSPLEQERVAALWNPLGHSSSLDWRERRLAPVTGQRGCIVQVYVLAFWSSEMFSRENLTNRQTPRSAYSCGFRLECGRSQPQPPVIPLFLEGIEVLTPRYREDASCRPRMGVWGSWDGCSWGPWCPLSLLLCKKKK